MKVLSYAVYIASRPLNKRWEGKKDLYLKGLFTQIETAKVIFPDWEVWVYVGKRSIDKKTKEEIKKKADKMIVFDDSNDYYGQMARFFPVSDENVDYVFVKDADSSLTWKEKKAVDTWIASDKDFIICRPYAPNAKWPIVAQLWGAKGGSVKNMEGKVKEYLKRHGGHWWVDQEFLRDEVWPIAKNSCIQFGDKNPQWGEVLPFPDLKEDKGVPCGLTVVSDKNANTD